MKSAHGLPLSRLRREMLYHYHNVLKYFLEMFIRDDSVFEQHIILVNKNHMFISFSHSETGCNGRTV